MPDIRRYIVRVSTLVHTYDVKSPSHPMKIPKLTFLLQLGLCTMRSNCQHDVVGHLNPTSADPTGVSSTVKSDKVYRLQNSASFPTFLSHPLFVNTSLQPNYSFSRLDSSTVKGNLPSRITHRFTNSHILQGLVFQYISPLQGVMDLESLVLSLIDQGI